MTSIGYRTSVLKEFGATAAEIEELLAYNENQFDQTSDDAIAKDEPFVVAWEEYAREAESVGAYPCLLGRLVQLLFPIHRGISTRSDYVAATRRGVKPPQALGQVLTDPKAVRITLHPTPAGRIPLLIVTNRSDFVALVQALALRNEPAAIPDSMGACFVSGYTNWDRLRQYRRDWESSHPEGQWFDEFHRVSTRKDLYQDRFIILSDGPYSGISAAEMDMPETVWRRMSLLIRREHECAHYFTRRCLGSMRNNLLDEIIADYMGIVEARGRFRAKWFLRFMGLAAYPTYRIGGRFENYVDGLSEGATAVLRLLLVRAAANLERCIHLRSSRNWTTQDKASTLRQLTRMTLEEMAAGSTMSGSGRNIERTTRTAGNSHPDRFWE